MDDLQALGSVATQLNGEFQKLFYVLLPIFFLLAIVIAWFRNPAGSPEFIDILRRAVIAALLLTAFPEIVNTIREVTGGIALKISDMSGLDTYLRMTREKAAWHASNQTMSSLIWALNDVLIASVAFVSFLILCFARYFMVTVYHFVWMFLIIVAPLVLSLHVFTSKITENLFRTLIEVACWQIVWAVLSAMLEALPYGNFQKLESGQTVLLLMNLVIALVMFLTPVFVRGIVGGSLSAVAGSLVPLTATTLTSGAASGMKLAAQGREVLSNTAGFMSSQAQRLRGDSALSIRKNEIADAVSDHRGRDGVRTERPPFYYRPEESSVSASNSHQSAASTTVPTPPGIAHPSQSAISPAQES